MFKFFSSQIHLRYLTAILLLLSHDVEIQPGPYNFVHSGEISGSTTLLTIPVPSSYPKSTVCLTLQSLSDNAGTLNVTCSLNNLNVSFQPSNKSICQTDSLQFGTVSAPFTLTFTKIGAGNYVYFVAFSFYDYSDVLPFDAPIEAQIVNSPDEPVPVSIINPSVFPVQIDNIDPIEVTIPASNPIPISGTVTIANPVPSVASTLLNAFRK